MKLKNVKVGTKVELKYNHDGLDGGTKGTIILNNSGCPYISWDNYTKGHNGLECEHTRIGLGLPENSVRAVFIERIKKVKE